MIGPNSPESGYVNDADLEFEVMTGMTDVEILHVSKINIIARGRRYGRLWLIKGLRPELRESNVNRRRLQKEFEIHSRLLDHGVVQTSGFEPVGDLGLCIVEEWIEGKTLAVLLQEGTLTKAARRRIMRDIIRTVGYIHSRGVVHRDLKPENVMVREAGGGTVIIDFGLADTNDYAELKQAAGFDFLTLTQKLRKSFMEQDNRFCKCYHLPSIGDTSKIFFGFLNFSHDISMLICQSDPMSKI